MKLAGLYAVLMGLLGNYPAMSAVLLDIGLMAAGYFRPVRYRRQLRAVVGVVTALSGAIVHSNAVPPAKFEGLAKYGNGDTSGK